MDVLACIKRVPDTGAKIVLTDDRQSIDASNLGFTMSPHEECAIEEAVQIVEDHGGSSTVLTLGSEDADEQLRTGLAMTVDEARLLETAGEEWRPRETANAIADAVRAESEDEDGLGYDLMLFGNESANAGNHQVGVRVAKELDVPFLAGVKSLEIEDGRVIAGREIPGGEEVYELELPAAISVKEGINEPRYASMRAKMRARQQEVERVDPTPGEFAGGIETVELEVPEEDEGRAEILGEGPEAVPEIVSLMRDDLEVT